MSRRRVRGRVLLLAFLVLCVGIITLDFRQTQTGPLQRVQEFAAAVVTPLQRGFTVVTRPVGNLFTSLAELANLRSENTRLKAEVERLNAAADQSDVFEAENVTLRRHARLRESFASMTPVTAQIIGNSSTNWKEAVQIDKGRAAGIRPDMAVIEPDGVVGKIVPPVTRTSATVLLLTDPSFGAAARITEAEITGIVTGSGSSENLSMKLVDNDANVSVGDAVETSSFNNGVFPPTIPIGEVTAVGEERAALDKEVEVEAAVNFRNLEYVDVLLETGPRIAFRGGRADGG